MLRFGVVLLTIGFVVQCSTHSLEHGKLIERIKRSPYYPKPASPPYGPHWPPPPPPHDTHWPPPPPPYEPHWPPPPHGPHWRPPPPPHGPHWPPPPPPFWHHHHHGPSFQQLEDDHPGPSFQQYSNQIGHPFQKYDDKNDQSNVSCESCKGDNAAVSKSESVNGDAIAISISRSNKNN